jgi:hypothetical protein
MHALEKMDNRKVSQMGMVVEKKRNLLGMKGPNKSLKLK